MKAKDPIAVARAHALMDLIDPEDEAAADLANRQRSARARARHDNGEARG
jgi:hypothetical protein